MHPNNQALKRHAIALFSLLATLSLTAQTTGRIVYEEKMDLHRNLPPDREDMKDMIPQYNTMAFELFFNDSVTVYKAQKLAEDPAVTSSTGNQRMMMRWGGRDTRVVYKHIPGNQLIDSRDFMQKQFLIKGPLDNRKWKITGKQKEILGQLCLSASTDIDTATHVVAWFAPQMAVFSGPSDYQGLPGMILQIDVNDGLRMITATDIVLEPVAPELLVAPTKGKEVTAEEFDKIREEKMKEMGMGGGGPMQMTIIRH